MNTPLNCLICGATFHQYNLKRKYCGATCRNKSLYAKRRHQLAKVRTAVVNNRTTGVQPRTGESP